MTSKMLFVLVLFLFQNRSSAETNKEYAALPEVFYMENYDMCMLLGDEALYCGFKYILEPVDKDNHSAIWNIIKTINAAESNYRHDYLRHYICVSKTCPGVKMSNENDPLFTKALEDCYNEKFKEFQLKGVITEKTCETQDPRFPVDWLDRFCGFLFVMYILFVLYATYYEVYAGYMTPEDYQKMTSTPKGKVLSAFSLSKNWIRLNTVKSTPEVEKFRSLQAIRFYNSALVVLAHTTLGFFSGPIANTRKAEEMMLGSSTILVGMGHLCMSFFLFISSFLLSYGLFTDTKDKEEISFKKCFWIFALRIFRLIPPFIVVILFNATWLRHVSAGPLFNRYPETEYINCRKNGWTNLLFIHNLVDSDNMCLPASWYMAVSTQYFILSLIFIWLLKKYEKYVLYILGAAALSQIFAAFLQNYYYDFPALQMYPIELYVGLKNFIASNEFQYHITSFIGNMAGPIIGIGFGYYYSKHQREKPDQQILNNTRGRVIFYTMIVMLLSCVFVPGTVMLFYSYEHDAFWASVYLALSRPIACLAIGTLIIGFSEGLGGLALRVCHWPPMYVLGRLTYSVYLVHSTVMLSGVTIGRYPSYVSHFSVIMRFCGDITLAYMVAALLTLFIELPVSALQKIIVDTVRVESKEGRKESIKSE